MKAISFLTVMMSFGLLVATGKTNADTQFEVGAFQKISDTAGGFGGVLDNFDLFGSSATNIGDLDGDGIQDQAVGAQWDSDGGFRRGAVYVLFMNSDGTVDSEQKISDTAGSFGGALNNDDRFGNAVAGIGDLNGDGVQDLAVGAVRDDDGGVNAGAVWILFMNTDGTVASEQKISNTTGGLGGVLNADDSFGGAIANIGDLDGDGVTDLAVGAHLDDDGGLDRGAVWILFMNTDGTVTSKQKISDTAGGFGGVLDNSDLFSLGVTAVGDLDGDGVQDLAVGANRDDDGGADAGAVWILFMNTDGTVASEQKISNTAGGFGGVLDGGDAFGVGVANIGDLDGNSVTDLAVGAPNDDDGGLDRGAVWILFVNRIQTGPALSLTPSSINFGAQIVDTISAEQPVTLSNTGTAALNISGIETSGDFAQSSTCSSILAAGATCTIDITFTPTDTGQRMGDLTVNSNATSSPDIVDLSGTGIPIAPRPSAATPIPTLSEWGMIILSSLLGLIIIGAVRLKNTPN